MGGDGHHPDRELEGTEGTDATWCRAPSVRIDVATFFGARPRDLLARLLEDDPLDLELRCHQRRDQLAYVVARPRLHARSVARAAYAGSRYRGSPAPDPWLERIIDNSLRELLEEDESGQRRSLPVEHPEDFEPLASVLGVDPAGARGVCVAFNQLVPDARRAFFAVGIGNRRLEAFARCESRPLEAVEADFHTAVRTITGVAGTGPALPAAFAEWPASW